eukprot:3373458-Lingulodinium_polyedra.AAC.1
MFGTSRGKAKNTFPIGVHSATSLCHSSWFRPMGGCHKQFGSASRGQADTHEDNRNGCSIATMLLTSP